MDLIDRQEVLAETGKWLNDLLEDDSATKIRVGVRMVRIYMKQMSAVKPEPQWHECFEDDPNSFPDDDRNVLVSFSNFSLSIIGQWRVDDNGSGCWYLGDTDETFLSEGLFVDGWWELPIKPGRD